MTVYVSRGISAAYLLESGFEDLEFHVPRMRLLEEGTEVTVVDTARRETYEGKHGLTGEPGRSAGEVEPADFDTVIIRGGGPPTS